MTVSTQVQCDALQIPVGTSPDSEAPPARPVAKRLATDNVTNTHSSSRILSPDDAIHILGVALDDADYLVSNVGSFVVSNQSQNASFTTRLAL